MKYLLLICLCSMLMVSTADAANPPITLLTAQQQVMTELSRLDNSLKKAAIELGTTGLSGTEARRVLLIPARNSTMPLIAAPSTPRGKW